MGPKTMLTSITGNERFSMSKKTKSKQTEVQEGLLRLLGQVKMLAKDSRVLTGRPLGCTGEIAEYEACRILGLTLCPARQAGYDAVRTTKKGEQRVQIKGRCLLPTSKPGQRIGPIDCSKEFDSVVLVLLDENFEARTIYEADRKAVVAALKEPGSKARNERGSLGVAKFKAIGRRVWPPTP
ncbi:MAG: hypothetical protein AB7T06_20835 [Kofleriaceae bacterium]